jgi:hypothetical protein
MVYKVFFLLSAYTEENFDTFLKWIQNNDRIQRKQITQTNEKGRPNEQATSGYI